MASNKAPLPESEDNRISPLREIMAEAGTESYRPLRSLAEARTDAHGIAVFEGDDGGQVYVVCPASFIRCDERTLDRLLQDLDEIEWPGNDPSMRRVYYESRRPGTSIPGGMGGGKVAQEPWIHPDLAKSGLAPAILDVLSGRKVALL